MGALHAAAPGHRRRQDGDPRPERAGRRVLHAPDPLRRRRPLRRPAARHRRDQPGLRPQHRRHHRPAEHPAALDPHRGRPRHLGAAGGGRAHDHPGLRRHARGSSSARRWPASPPTRSSTARRRWRRSATATSARPSSPTCPASSRPRSPARRASTSPTRPTTSRSSASYHPELGPGFDVWVGGGLSTNPMFAQRLGAWVSLEEIPEVWVGVVSIFRDHGYRRLRNRARLKFLLADWGPEKFREVLETGVPRPRARRRAGPRPPAPPPPRPHRRAPPDRRAELGRRLAGGRPGQRRRPRPRRRAREHATARVAYA